MKSEGDVDFWGGLESLVWMSLEEMADVEGLELA